MPESCILTVVHQSFAGKTDKKEKWYGTDYSSRQFTETELSLWRNALRRSSPSSDWERLLHLPKKNLFIPTDFSLKDVVATVPVFNVSSNEPESESIDRPSLIFVDEIRKPQVETLIVDEEVEHSTSGNLEVESCSAPQEGVEEEEEEEDNDEQVNNINPSSQVPG